MRTFLLSLILIVGNSTSADPGIAWEELAIATVDGIIADGIDSIGKLDLHALREEMRTVEYDTISKKLPSFVGDRSSAYYVGGKVYLRDSYPEEHRSAVELLTLHEALGALNFRDEEYSPSILIKMLADSTPEEKKDLVESQAYQSFFDSNPLNFRHEESGGATGVGGGGDFISAWFKYKVLQKFMSQAHRAFNLMILYQIKFEPTVNEGSLGQMTIEPHDPPAHQGMIAMMKSIYEDNPKFLKEQKIIFQVRVPTKRFQENSELIESSVNEMVEFYNELSKGLQHGEIDENHLYAKCGYRLLIVPHKIIRSDLLRRSGGMNPFIEQFKQDCTNDYNYPTQVF